MVPRSKRRQNFWIVGCKLSSEATEVRGFRSVNRNAGGRPNSSSPASANPREAVPPLPREEYIEQAHLFRALQERTATSSPIQETLEAAKHEILVTTKLPMAIDFMLGELRHSGGFATAMSRLRHYFTPFQTFLVQQAEDDRGRFDLRTALAVLTKEAEYRASNVTAQGEFLFQFETLCRNRLSYDAGLAAMAEDPIFDTAWRDWILIVRRQVGIVDLSDLIYVRSAFYRPPPGREVVEVPAVLFGEKEGRIAWANRRKDPLFLFAALQRQLGYPEVPRPPKVDESIDLVPQMARRLERLGARVKLLEEEQKGGIDITKFYSGRLPFSDGFNDDRSSS